MPRTIDSVDSECPAFSAFLNRRNSWPVATSSPMRKRNCRFQPLDPRLAPCEVSDWSGGEERACFGRLLASKLTDCARVGPRKMVLGQRLAAQRHYLYAFTPEVSR